MAQKKQVIDGTGEPHHAHGLSRRTFDHFQSLPPDVNYAPAHVPEELRETVEAAGALVPRKSARKGPAATTRQALLEVSHAKPIKVVDPTPKQFVDLNDPTVSEHAAGVIVRNVLDYSKSAKQLQPSLSPVDSALFAHQLRQSPTVQQAVAKELARLGLDQKGREQYFQILWAAALNQSPQGERERLQALRLLSRLYLPSENPSGKVDAPVTLPIEDFRSGLAAMGLDEKTLASVQVGEFSPTEFEDENDDSAQEGS